MQVLSYGYKLPETDDRGSVWFPALEDNITRVNGHTHDGVSSALISTASISKFSQDILNAAWVAQGNGTYKQTVSMPVSVNMADFNIRIEINSGASDGHIIYPTIEWVSTNSYDIYINDNTLDLRALYS